ncbi:uncharacterized protein [Amphiura filiformis]|uniref:uncharacterized protein isoform X1 n=1 Tax=Amphiura filiformis TaxID=82378 RepID=UPI003B20F17B
MDIGKVQRPGSLASQSHHQSALSQQSTRTTRQGSRHSVSGPMPSPINPVMPSQHAFQQSQHALQLPSSQHAYQGGGGSSLPGWGYQSQMQKKKNGSGQTTPDGRKAKRKTKNAELDLDRPCKEHSFITDINDVRNMQEGLLKLLDDFDSGRVQAFDAHCSFEKMDNIRDLQEKLARTHFQMDAQLRAKGGNTQEAMELASSNMDHLLSNLDQLSIAIRSLHPPRDEDDVFVSQPR